MEKANVTKFDLEAAFKALDAIEIPVASKGKVKANRVNLKERLSAKAAHEVLVEDYYDVNDMEDLEVASEEREAEIAKAKLARIEKIVDLDAESEEDILPSYVGKIIMQCPQCMTLFYKNEEDIETSEEAPDVVNINEICQHCGNASGYTLVGKVGGIEEEEEAENFDLSDVDAEVAPEETEEEIDNQEAETEEVPTEDTEETASEDEFDLSDLDELDLEEEPVEESMNNSKLLDKIEKDNDLKTDMESKHVTLNEDKLEGEEETEEVVEESMNNSELLKDIEKKNDLKTKYESEFTTLNEAAEEEPVVLEEVENFDEESFNEHLNTYLTSVYSNVKCFEATSCTIDKTNFIVEGKINFNSGRQKTTKFIFENTKYGFRGENKDFAQNKAFTLNTRVLNKTLFTESFTYNYRINESLVQGHTN